MKQIISIIILVVSIYMVYDYFSLTACDCAKLKNETYVVGYSPLGLKPTSSQKKMNRKIEKCRDKFDGLNNAERECNEKEISVDKSAIEDPTPAVIKEAPSKYKAVPTARIKKTSAPKMYEINDPDGYSNLRESPGGKIICRVMKGEKFEIVIKEETNSLVKLSDGKTGYIHNSRIKLSN
jgi:hypothetical protein